MSVDQGVMEFDTVAQDDTGAVHLVVYHDHHCQALDRKSGYAVMTVIYRNEFSPPIKLLVFC